MTDITVIRDNMNGVAVIRDQCTNVGAAQAPEDSSPSPTAGSAGLYCLAASVHWLCERQLNRLLIVYPQLNTFYVLNTVVSG